MSSKNEFSRPVPLSSIEKGGYKINIEANEKEKEGLSHRFEVDEIRSFSADLTVYPKADQMTYKVQGRFTADVMQSCIVSGDPVSSHLEDRFEAWYRDQSKILSFIDKKQKIDEWEEGDEHELRSEEEDPEILNDGILDLGEVAAQFLGLAINPYPKAEENLTGDHIETKEEDKPNPFAKLAALKTKE